MLYYAIGAITGLMIVGGILVNYWVRKFIFQRRITRAMYVQVRNNAFDPAKRYWIEAVQRTTVTVCESSNGLGGRNVPKTCLYPYGNTTRYVRRKVRRNELRGNPRR